MSRRRRSSYSQSKLAKRHQSQFINVSQRPRALIIDPQCERCHGWGKVMLRHRLALKECPRCRGSGKDPEGDKWFDNQDRVRTISGSKYRGDYEPIKNNTFIRKVPRTLQVGAPIDTFKVQAVRTASGLELQVIERITETPASSAVRYTEDHLPRRFVVDEIQRLRQSDKRTIIEKMDKYIYPNPYYKQLKLFFAGDTYCFVEEFEGWARRSMVYTGREHALKMMRDGLIGWRETIEPSE